MCYLEKLLKIPSVCDSLFPDVHVRCFQWRFSLDDVTYKTGCLRLRTSCSSAVNTFVQHEVTALVMKPEIVVSLPLENLLPRSDNPQQQGQAG